MYILLNLHTSLIDTANASNRPNKENTHFNSNAQHWEIIITFKGFVQT